MIERPPLPLGPATAALGRCGLRVLSLLATGRLRQPTTNLGRRLRFADGSQAAVYRETSVRRPPTAEPTVLVVSFRLRAVRSDRAHALFRAESLLNTVLFAGFPGFVSKLWLRHDEHGRYRGFYEWDGSGPAEDYVRALHRVLALVSERGSIHYAVLPGLRRDDVLESPELTDEVVPPADPPEWWRLVDATAVEPA